LQIQVYIKSRSNCSRSTSKALWAFAFYHLHG